MCAVDHRQAPFRVQGFGWGATGSCSPEDWRVPCLRSPHTRVRNHGEWPQTKQTCVSVHPHNRTVTAGSLLLPHTCVLSHSYTRTIKKNKSGPVTLASLVLQHTGRRARAQSYTQAPPRSGDHGLLTSPTHMCAQCAFAYALYHFMRQNT